MSEAGGASDSTDPVVAQALASLPRLSAEQIPSLEDSCPICLISFGAILDKSGSEALGKSIEGVTRVDACGHLFCTEDLSEWIRGRHGTCPACRHEFIPELRPVDSDTESSDDEEYFPAEYDADSDFDTDEEGLFDSDGIDIETMDVDADEADDELDSPYDSSASGVYRRRRASRAETESMEEGSGDWWDESVDGEQEWGLTEDDSMTASEGELSLGERLPGPGIDIQVRLNSEGEYSIEEETREAPKS